MVETVVLAVGGNSLILDNQHVSVQDQYSAAEKTAENMVELIKAGHKVALVHGNGPQVGFILRRGELAAHELHQVPVDSCVADTQGALGYNLVMALNNVLARHGLKKSVTTVVTQVEVSGEDPAFKNPTKPIGSFMTEEIALERQKENGWDITDDAGRGFRRVIPSPIPRKILEIDVIRLLLQNGVIVIAAGGGGIPVKANEDGTYTGIEAVIDKDLAAALLADNIKADHFIISTAVEKVCLNFGTPEQKALSRITVAEAEQYVKEGHFAAGSMLPKIQAMIQFVKSTGKPGIITDPAHLAQALKGQAGTHIVP